MYRWRQLTETQRRELLKHRKQLRLPWHSPPHFDAHAIHYHLTAACYQHQPIIGHGLDRMASFEATLLETLRSRCRQVVAWCVLPNHYHCLIETDAVLDVLRQIGRMHGRLSWQWNGEEDERGRKVWCNCVERAMRTDRHFWATLNYIHHNPVHHRYVKRWDEWPFTSAAGFLSEVGRERAAALWREYPVLDYGKGWDEPGS